MEPANTFQSPTGAFVNYTTVRTSAPNEVYVSTTQSPDSLSNLIKNNIIIEFSMTKNGNELMEDKEAVSTSTGVIN